MKNITADDLITVKVLAEEMGVPVHRAAHVLKHVEPTLKAGNTRLWDRDEVKEALYFMNEGLLRFLGVRPPSESYDVNITASEDKE